MSQHLHRLGVDSRRDRQGVILLVTLVILVILSTLGYTLYAQVAARRHRDQYIIDYSIARHACASGLKYALAAAGSLQFDMVSRPNEPDFSDVFALREAEYQKLLDQVAAKLAADAALARDGFGQMSGKAEVPPPSAAQGRKGTAKQGSLKKAALGEEVDDFNDFSGFDPNGSPLVDPKQLKIRGPYGPPWPLMTEPMEFEIGAATIVIEIEDENAKYPLGWAMITDDKLKAPAGAGWTTFCEWMGYTSEEIYRLNQGIDAIRAVKPFKVEFQPETENVEPPASLKNKITRPAPNTPGTVARRTVTRKPVSVEVQIERQNKEYAKLLHSPLIDRDLLSRPSALSDTRQECALKYLGLWGTRHVNLNTAPRQVLEAALTFGSLADAPKIAEAIIQQRRTRPVADVNELKQTMPRYANALDNCRIFLTTRSNVLAIRVTAYSGVARVAAMVAVVKEGDKVQQIAVVSE